MTRKVVNTSLLLMLMLAGCPEPGDDGGEPGECLGEVDDPQPDLFVGDGVPDMALEVRTIVAEPPQELVEGARIHVQGSYFDCCDDDIVVPESVVVRSYPQERFILGNVASWHNIPPQPAQSFFDAIGTDLDTWLAPFELSSHDDGSCAPIVDGNLGAIKTRTRLYVDAGECETAKIIDEQTGYFADVFFVSVNDMTLWEPSGETVDTITLSSVFISRQPCEGDECPATADVLECPTDDVWPQDSAQISFWGYEYEPSATGYDHVCEILSVTDDGDIVEYELDCGMLCPAALGQGSAIACGEGSPAKKP